MDCVSPQVESWLGTWPESDGDARSPGREVGVVHAAAPALSTGVGLATPDPAGGSWSYGDLPQKMLLWGQSHPSRCVFA